MGQFQFINLDQLGGMLTAALNRPKANAFNETMIEEWLSVLKIADRDESVRCLVLTGTGRIFGADRAWPHSVEASSRYASISTAPITGSSQRCML